MFHFLGRVTGLPLGSSVLGLPPFGLWTSVFCSGSSADDEQLYCCDSVPRASLVRVVCTGQVKVGFQ